MMNRILPRVLWCVLVSAALLYSSMMPAAAFEIDGRVTLGIELLLVDVDGIHLLRSKEVELGLGGAHHQSLELGPDSGRSLVFRVAYQPGIGDTIELDLERSIRENEERHDLPAERQVISVFDAWSYTLLDESGLGGRLELRVVPFVREVIDDERFEGSAFPMSFKGGPLIRYGEGVGEDRVIFRQVNTGGQGLRMGIPQVGMVKLSHLEFPGSAPCGWVRGHQASFRILDELYGLFSTVQILPEERSRPGKGWTLFCSGHEDSAIHSGWWAPLVHREEESLEAEIVESRAIDLNWAMELQRSGRWGEALALADRLLQDPDSMAPIQSCEARYHRIYASVRLGDRESARLGLAEFEPSCADLVKRHWLRREIDKLRGEL